MIDYHARAPQVVPGWKPPSMPVPRAGSDTPRATLAPVPQIAYVPPAPSPAGTPSPIPATSSRKAKGSPPPATPAPTTPPASRPGAQPEKEPSMARRTQPAGTGRQQPGRNTPGGKVSAQFQICALLMAEGDLTRSQLESKVDVSSDSALTNAIFNAKNLKRITKDKSTGKYSVTKAGREWASGGSNLDNQRRAATSPRAVKRVRREPAIKGSKLDKGERQRLGVVNVTSTGALRGPLHLATDADAQHGQLQVLPVPSFRCSIGSDRCFNLRKGGNEIELTPSETLELLLYVDRVRGIEAPAPVAARA